MFACIFGRALSIYPLTLLANALGRKHAITNQECLMMWFSGLRGPVSFALAFRISSKAVPDEDDRNTIITTTLLIIWVTSFFMGGMSNTVLKWLQLIPNYNDNEELDLDKAQVGISREKTLMESNHWFKKLNIRYLQKPFGTESREFTLRHDISMAPRAFTNTAVGRKRKSMSVIMGGPMHESHLILTSETTKHTNRK